MSRKFVEYSDDDDDVNVACGVSGPSLVATHGKGGPDSTGTRGGNTDIVSRGKNESLFQRPSEKGKVHQRDESNMQREKVDDDVKKNDAHLGNIYGLSKEQNSQSAEAAKNKVYRKESHINGLSLLIAIIAIIIALYSHVGPIQHPKEYVEHNQEPDEYREKLSQCLSWVASSAQEIKHIQFKLESIEKKVENFVANKSSNADLVKKEDLGNLFRDIKIYLQNLEDVKKEETKKIFQDEVLKLKTEVDVKVDELKEKQEKESQWLEKKNAEMVWKMSKLQSTVQNLKVNFVRLSEFNDKNNNEVAMKLSQQKEILTGMKQSEETLGNWVKHIANETTVLNNSTDYIMENIFHKGSMIVVIMINTSLVVMVIIYLYLTRGTHRYINQNVDIEQVHVGVSWNPSPYSTAGRILSKVRTDLRLEKKLCIISFYDDTHPLHMRMTQSFTQQLNQQLVEFIIRRHEDILEIPKVFLYFLFVDFNERNVIIEDPTLGLGDLRLTTVQAIQKMSGRIVILYVKDPNSKQLDCSKLYNKNLASVTTQRELSALNRISRFISSYESLTDFQKAHLRLIVENELKGH
ncbi:hypothetical protein CHS0354_004310 [Potamilus streckersoni]|uniref:Uncharacterized protein n=1 Tax=Potamilus streckersoni TaxID=2493646 RepID=A0AAE0VNV1_9BIVA|nr:hypothetical protein CHS0354_004310 [Potamilus streckersoni]